MEIQKDAFEPGSRIVIVDDVLATGSTTMTGASLIRSVGGEITGCAFVISLSALPGKQKV